MDNSTKFRDKTAARYARRPVADEAVYQEKLQATRGYPNPNYRLTTSGSPVKTRR